MDGAELNDSFLYEKGFKDMVKAMNLNDDALKLTMEQRRLLCVQFAIRFLSQNLRLPTDKEWADILEKFKRQKYPQIALNDNVFFEKMEANYRRKYFCSSH